MNERLLQAQVAAALAEDLGSGDVSAALLPADCRVSAAIFSREPMLLCGIAWVEESFHQLNPTIQLEWLFSEGHYISEPATLCNIQGSARAILSAERTALNFLQTLSATANKRQRG
jgi:nicotinate-nucleotide pyrophosphorylase (carboxylating)